MGNICSCFETANDEIMIIYNIEPVDNYLYENLEETEQYIYRLYD